MITQCFSDKPTSHSWRPVHNYKLSVFSQFTLLCQWGQSHTSQLQFTSNSIISVNQRFAVLKMKFNYTMNRFKLTSLDTHIPFFRAISTILWLSGERLFWMLQTTLLQILQGDKTLCNHLAILFGTESLNGQTHHFLCCYALHNFSSWTLPVAGRVFNHSMTIWLPLFWSTWSKTRGHDLHTCAGLARDQIL